MNVARGDRRERAARRTRAGFASRAVAGLLDIGVLVVTEVVLLYVVGVIRYLFDGGDTNPVRPYPWVTAVLFAVVGVLIFGVAWSGSGRTLGNSLVGLRVVRADGRPITWWRAVVRALVVVGTLGLGLLLSLVSRRNRALWDVWCDTAVIYDWRPRRGRPAREETRPPE